MVYLERKSVLEKHLKLLTSIFNPLYMFNKRECLDILVLSCLLTTKGLILNIFRKFRGITFIEVHKCLTKITETLSGKDVSEIDYLKFRKASIITLKSHNKWEKIYLLDLLSNNHADNLYGT